jgi:hypothetical protein
MDSRNTYYKCRPAGALRLVSTRQGGSGRIYSEIRSFWADRVGVNAGILQVISPYYLLKVKVHGGGQLDLDNGHAMHVYNFL